VPTNALTQPARPGITLRAVLLGLVSVVGMCWLATYQLHVTGSSVMTLSNFPVCALIVFVFWLLVNGVVRAVAPRRALTAGEILTILVMAWAAGMMPGRGWSGRMVGNLAAFQHYASPENRWDEILGPLLPRWLVPETTASSAMTQAGHWFYTGAPEGAPWPWTAWAVPLVWWSLAALAMLCVAISISVIFHRQWVVNERLNFPLVGVTIALADVKPGQRVSPIFRSKAFWLGFVVVFGPLFWNLGGYLSPGWPKFSIYKSAWEIRQEILPGFPWISFRIMPLVIGFLYLCNLKLLFSLWFFWLLGWIEAGVSNNFGLAVGQVGQKLSGPLLVSSHNYGALIFLVLWSIWVARRHLRSVWRSAWSRHRIQDNPGGVMSYRTALVLLGLALTFLVSFFLRIGMTLGVAIPALCLILVAFFLMAKYMAATGLAYILPPSLEAGGLMESLVGNAWMTPRSAVGLGLVHGGAFGASPRVYGFGMMPHALKIGDEARLGRRRLLPALALALLVAAAFSTWHTLHLGYSYAALRMDNYTLKQEPQRETEIMARRVDAIQNHRGLPADIEKIGAWGVGFVGAGVLMFLTARLTAWPLHPIGLAFSGSEAVTKYWLCILIVWFSKLIILKTGGVQRYEKAKPFFIGLVVGYVFVLMLSYAVHEFFPGQWYQIVHDW